MAYLMAVAIGGMIGGWLPTLFGASYFSVSSILGGAVGGLLGIWLVYKLAQ